MPDTVMRTREISVHGIPLNLFEAGEPAGAQGAAASLLFIHGWTSRHQIFRHQLAEFARERHVVAVDLPGHGASGRPQIDYTVPFFAETLEGLVRALFLRRVIVIGHSLGALAALELARMAGPERVPAAILIEAAPIIRDETMTAQLAKTSRVIEAEGIARAQMRLAELAFFEPGEETDAVREEMAAGLAEASSLAAQSAWRGLIDWQEGIAALGEVRVPLLFVNGARPQNREAAIRAVTAAPVHWGRTVCAGHFNLLTAPTQVNAMIGDFLARLPS
ncbi:MAG: alpha/beta hydrolase [Alphaproteobacteria bacterium]|nr:MAG: alpha/beta hydrolase [Alphaproteobacteria bacterium]